MASSGEEIYVSYHDSLLRRSDVDLLADRQWLNDSVVSFVYEYFEREMFPRHSGTVMFVSPEVTQCIKMLPDDSLPQFLDTLDIGQRKQVFFAVNNSMERERDGGSHWSLLVWTRSGDGEEGDSFGHYDSSMGMNAWDAKLLARRLTGQTVPVVEHKCVQQVNGYDCGPHMLAATEHLAKLLLGEINQPVETAVTARVAADYRIKILDLARVKSVDTTTS